MKKLFIVLFSFVCLSSYGQKIVDVFKTMPNTIIPGLSDDNRTIFLINANADSTIIPYAFGEIKRLIYYDDYLKIQTSDIGTTQLKIIQTENNNPIIGVIKTVCGNACNSQISFYTVYWQKINSSELLPKIYAELFFDQSKKGTQDYSKALSLFDINFIEAEFDVNSNNLKLKLDYKNYVSQYNINKIKPFILKESIVLNWDNSKYK